MVSRPLSIFSTLYVCTPGCLVEPPLFALVALSGIVFSSGSFFLPIPFGFKRNLQDVNILLGPIGAVFRRQFFPLQVFFNSTCSERSVPLFPRPSPSGTCDSSLPPPSFFVLWLSQFRSCVGVVPPGSWSIVLPYFPFSFFFIFSHSATHEEIDLPLKPSGESFFL